MLNAPSVQRVSEIILVFQSVTRSGKIYHRSTVASLSRAGANEIPGTSGKRHPLLLAPRAPYEKDDARADACGTRSAAGTAVDRCRGAKV